MEELRGRVAAVMSEVLEVQFPADANVCRDQVDSWDSIKHMELILHLEDEFGIRFTLEQAAGLQDMDSILRIIEAVL